MDWARHRPMRIAAMGLMAVAASATLMWDAVSTPMKIGILVAPAILLGVYAWSRSPSIPKAR